MPGDPHKKLRRGDRISAEAFSTVQDAATFVRERLQRTGTTPTPETKQSGIILVRNETTGVVPRFGVMGLGPPIIEPSANLDEFKRQVTFECNTPTTADAGRFVILQEPLTAGEIGKAVVAGATWVKVQVNSGEENYRRAKVINADTAKLAMSTSGPAEVLWMESGTGEKWACVRLVAGLSLGDPVDFGDDYVLFWDSSVENFTWLSIADLTVLIGGGAAFSGARVTHGSDQTVSSGVELTVAFDTESDPNNFDTNAYHDTVTNKERLTVPAAGYYHVGCEIGWQSGAVGTRRTRIVWTSGGTDRVVSQVFDVVTNVNHSQQTSALVNASSGDYFTVKVFQDGASNATVHRLIYAAPVFWIRKAG